MKNTFYSVCIIAVSVLFTSCFSAHQVYTDRATGVAFDDFKTYAWLPVIDTSWTSLFYDQNVQYNIMEQVDEQMEERNYRLDTLNPDVLILLHLRFRKDDEGMVDIHPLANTYSYYYKGFSPVYWSDYFYPGYKSIQNIHPTEVGEIQYTTGTLVIDVIQNHHDDLIWRGWSLEPVKRDYTTRDFMGIVSDIFQTYPVEKRNRIAYR